MQAVTHIAPAVGTLLSLQFIASLAGVTAPLAFAIAFVIILTLGISLTQLARKFPSAGGYYTYVSRTVHPKAGWFTAWLYFLYDPLATAINLAFMGYFFQVILKAQFNIRFDWWWFFLLSLALITVLVYRGVAISARVMLTLGGLELLIILALAISGLVSPGPGGITLDAFIPANAPGASGLFLAVIFSIFLFTGFESVAPLAEETANPKKLLPRAIIVSIILVGAFFVICNWAIMIGYGTDNVKEFVSSADNPVIALAERLWGWGWLLVLFAMVNSIIAVSIACTNAATRVFFSMGRIGALPRWFGRVHPRFKTPRNAVIFQTIVTLVFGLGMGAILGPDQEFFMMGVAITLGLILVYIAGNIGVFLYYFKEDRKHFNVLLHLILPLFSTVALLVVGYLSIIPFPAFPVGIAPILVAVWILIGIGLTIYASRTGRGEWLDRAAHVYEEPAEIGLEDSELEKE
ncbi:APC family permease [Rathayibacter soli]|uniref:APC family permease n=1 Tax=Rathayibacter soli TaxID=3144168 RepID=UPI0027E45728|nr:APC family permease [Glaciibacter superstes]